MIISLGVIDVNIAEATKARIEELCNERNLNFCQLATISGIPYTTIKSIIYNQSKNPGITTIKKICDGLDITITDFFNTDTFKNLEQEIE
jgi:transcriptional regulator with XRE-family HTH domain